MACLGARETTLFEARAARPRPHLDDKVITAWNGLMIAAFARAARVLVDSPRRDEWRQAAERAADARPRPICGARPSAGCSAATATARPRSTAFCEDYACLAWGVLELFQATGDARWLDWALELTDVADELFCDERDGGWFSTTGEDPSVLLRLKEDYDGAEPPAASVTVRNLIALGAPRVATRRCSSVRAARSSDTAPASARWSRVMPLMVSNLALWHGGAPQVVIAGTRGAADTLALEAVVAKQYAPGLIQMPLPVAGADASLAGRLPWLGAMQAREGHATAYVCRDFSCQAPVSEPEALTVQLQAVAGPRLIT